MNYDLAILLAMQRKIPHIYEGTADPAKVAKRRAANKVARRQRKINRGVK